MTVVTLAGQTSELERTREALRASEDRLRMLMANIPGAVYQRALDPTMTIEFVSDAIEAITGYGPEDLIDNRQQAYASLIDPDELAAIAEEVEAAAREQRHYGLAYRIVRADGEKVWVGDRGQAVHGDGDVIWLYGTLSNIDERKRIEADRARMEVELRMAQKLESVGQLAAGIAHEINTPIQFVGDSLHFLKDSFDDLDRLIAVYRDACATITDDPALHARLEEAEEDVDLAYLQERVPAACVRTLEGVERVASIVRAMKEFAHPQTEQAPADLDRALATTLTVARNEYKYLADVETYFGEIPHVVCNLSDLNQVFLNLIINAAHAIEDVGAERGTITIRTAVEGDTAVVSVGDSGAGIPDEIRSRIFDPFFTTKAVGRGSGQGLAIARAVIEKHHGSISADSTVGEGTTFTIRLPLGGVAPQDRAAA